MTHTHILLVCATGMSTNMLVSKLRKAADKHNQEVSITAVSANEADVQLNAQQTDIVLLGPQVRYMKTKFQKKVEGKNIKVAVINTKDYGMMNADKILTEATSLTEKRQD